MNDDQRAAMEDRARAFGDARNTDRELWREREGDYYADSIHVTEGGGIGINCGGIVIVKPLREWHRLATECAACVELVRAAGCICHELGTPHHPGIVHDPRCPEALADLIEARGKE